MLCNNIEFQNWQSSTYATMQQLIRSSQRGFRWRIGYIYASQTPVTIYVANVSLFGSFRSFISFRLKFQSEIFTNNFIILCAHKSIIVINLQQFKVISITAMPLSGC